MTIKMEFFSVPFHQQWLSNPPSTSEPWSSDSSNHNPLKMSLSSENGSMEKSIKGFNVVSQPWLPWRFSLIHQITVSHSLLASLCQDRQRTLCIMAAPLLQVESPYVINTNCTCLTVIVFLCLVIVLLAFSVRINQEKGTDINRHFLFYS